MKVIIRPSVNKDVKSLPKHIKSEVHFSYYTIKK